MAIGDGVAFGASESSGNRAILVHRAAVKTVLQLDRLTRLEKLRAMEELWEDLSSGEEEYESPQWHGEVLRAREEALKAGEDEFVRWEEAKRILRERKRFPYAVYYELAGQEIRVRAVLDCRGNPKWIQSRLRG